jgi:molecular chaperone HtpG
MANDTSAVAETASEAGATSHEFQAEVAKLLHLMVHSVYSDRDVFLRELISNAADALDKLRYEALEQSALLEGSADLTIMLTADKQAKTLTITDTGIGMNERELVENLGTIAKSGTQAFVEQAKARKDDVHLIGQFGIGFYSAFIVASRVDVISRRAGSADAFIWSSDGSGSFTLAPAASATPRGTSIVLHLRDDAQEFLEDWKIESVVRTYSDHIAHPIMLTVASETARQINTANAIWTRPKSDITAEQHKEFFGHLSGNYADPALTLHYRAEGRNEYTVLLYVPSERPFDLYDPERRGRQKLYVRRVYIADDVEILPAYLRFVRGIVDSEDMPLNISREMLQNNPQVAAIRKAVTNKVLAELKKLAEMDEASYRKIWEVFGPVLKEGLYEDMERRDQLYEIARFRTTSGEFVTLKDYVSRLKENQTAIYYLTAEDAAKAQASPQLEGYRARDVEVLLLVDPVDSFWIRTALGYEGKPFKSVTQGAADLDLIKRKDEAASPPVDEPQTALLVAALKQALEGRVKDVRPSQRLTESAVCLVNDGAMDRTLEKLLARQKEGGFSVSAPILEINPSHPLIQALGETVKSKGAGAVVDPAQLLLDQAFIIEGEPVPDPAAFTRRLAAVMARALA